VVLYTALLGSAAALLAVVLHLGGSLVAPLRSPGEVPFRTAGPAAHGSGLLALLLALIVVMVCARGLGLVAARLGQAPVIGEMIAGILLGPSLVGRLWPEPWAALFSPHVTDLLGMGAQVSVVLFMFLVGLELDPARLKGHSHVTIVTSHAGIVAPFVLGAFLALYLYPRYSTRDVPFLAFALFCGVSLSVTAFPVLVRILGDLGIQHTRLGTLALACAAVDDATAWLLLAALMSVTQADATSALWTLGLTLAYVAFMIGLARPRVEALVRAADRRGGATASVLSVAFIALLTSALVTEGIGIHALFGAFLMGVVTPHDSGVARALKHKLEDFVVVLALPVFFAFSGLRTRIGLVDDPKQWLDLLVIVAAASIGKIGGCFLTSWRLGVPRREAWGLGVLMNTRGLMELIVLNVGLDLKVLSPELFALLVLMAVITTVATTPLLRPLARSLAVSEAGASS
jgi:Kef-type K+ transport system membrane component KefB